eukprot:CAMPEP_0113420788 /NCGR_PEP_ID=MMETSP0013_2-20120614/27523_1 /TAXON_ID=2843 ORGANISM="Skeletonema costatum, Strain 1716" /NCGR_SAMPLE_ID=MMETSP0013_2 /ASSEMBLY_ACC=CAM_ASM_000158 /LENGTH=542 /DNA_ID=CAMNT_0000308307 /DNA_START=52 /DNA_END=1676 /DNA_ORIENTATION=- /assembly_acc=CAM_ASM_000158
MKKYLRYLMFIQMMKRICSFQNYHRHDVSHQLMLRTSSMLMSTSSNSDDATSRRRRIAVIGGGASGMFAATAAADASSSTCDVVVFEGTSKTMSKVRISGGGRCNVMHDVTKPLPQILSSYPRGNKELRGLYTKRFTPDDAYDWFTSRGVELKTESDGRMFPVTDNSQTIIDTITHAAIKAGVEVRTKSKVQSVEWIDSDDNNNHDNGNFAINVSSRSATAAKEESKEYFDALILATGSFPIGHEIARSLGHKVIKPVPSLFTFDTKELVREGGTFHGLAGLSVQTARLTLTVSDEMKPPSADDLTEQPPSNDEASKPKKKKRKKKAPAITQEGPLLITHHGISGPATLRLSAFAAREFHAVKYNCEVKLHFCPKFEEQQRRLGSTGGSEDILMDALWEMTRLIPKRRVATGCPLFMTESIEENDDTSTNETPNAPIIPKRLWAALVSHSSISPDLVWGDASKAMIRSLANNLASFPLKTTGFSSFKEEFVTAGGIFLKEVQLTNMESKIRPGLFMAGEVLDVDGVTGGFNFMGCWSTGFVA